jgi:hypothetical protein
MPSATVTVRVTGEPLIHARVQRAPGSTFDTTDEHAAQLVERGLVEIVTSEREPELELASAPASRPAPRRPKPASAAK